MTPPKEKSLLLIDGHALFFRAYYAFIKNPLLNSEGKNVSAIFGFANSLLKLWSEEKPDFMGVTFDRPEPTFRHEMYSEYKANRDAIPDDLKEQIPLLFDFVDTMNLKQLSLPGVEADDLLGTLSRQASEKDIHTYIVTGDKDLFQVINDKVSIFNIRAISNPKEQKILDSAFVMGKYGIPHERMIDYLTLVGDASDNIPGAKGVGKKTAEKLIKQFSTIEDLFLNLDQVKSPSLREKILSSKENIFLSRKLVTIKTDLDLSCQPRDMSSPEELPEKLRTWLDEHEFPSLKKYFQTSTQKELPQNNFSFEKLVWLQTPILWDEFLTNLSPSNPISLMFFSKKDLPEEKVIVFHSDSKTVGIPLKELEKSKEMQTLLRQAFKRNDISWVFWDAKITQKHFYALNLEMPQNVFDLTLSGFLLNPETRNPSLGDLLKKHSKLFFSIELDSLCWDETLLEKAPLAGHLCLTLSPILLDSLKKTGLEELFRNIESPMTQILNEMEQSGIQVDENHLQNMNHSLNEEMLTLKKTVFDHAGIEFNINSPKQLGEILFDRLKIHLRYGFKKAKKTKTGSYATSSSVLEIYQSIPLVASLLRYRILSKLQSTYVEPLPKLMEESSKRIHATFHQTVTVTGRLSSSNPNLQNIPIRTKEGAKIREAFVAGEGNLFLASDYSQMELRILAHLSKDPAMVDAFKNKRDIHAETAAKIFSVPVEEVSSLERSRAKAVNFGVIYGMGAFRLSQDTGLSLKEASHFIERYFEIYSGVSTFIEETIQKAKVKGETCNLFGRIRKLPGLLSEKKSLQILAEHMAINTPIQSAAADIIKIAMIRIQSQLKQSSLKAKMLLQVHDELLFEAPEEEIEPLKILVTEEMEGAYSLDVPLEVQLEVGKNWLEVSH